MNNSQNEIVEELRRSLLLRYSYQIRSGNKINTEFIKLLIEREGIDGVLKAGIILLSEFRNKKQIYLPDIRTRRRPQEALKILFNEILDEGYEKKMGKVLANLHKRGDEKCLFLIKIFMEKATKESVSQMKEILEEINNGWKFSKQGSVKQLVAKGYKSKIQDFLDKTKPPELSLVFRQSY